MTKVDKTIIGSFQYEKKNLKKHWDRNSWMAWNTLHYYKTTK